MSGRHSDHWGQRADEVIYLVHRSLPEEATLAQRKKAIDEAYPFGERRFFPYKVWLKKRRAYLVRFGYRPRTKASAEGPLEQLMRGEP